MVCSLLGLLYCSGFEVWAFVFNGDNMWRKLASQPIMYALVIVLPGLTAVIYGAMLFGSVRMLQRKSYRWATTASILALIPSSVLVVLSIGFGIWGLVVLRNRDVKAAFG
jgi:membrane protein YdbS with pleckstrin-like domain